MSLPTQQRLNEHLIRWNLEQKDYESALSEYGRLRADLEYRRAVVMETAKAADEKLSQASAERVADADPELYRLHLAFRAAEATVAAKKERLRWCAAVADALRSEIATERAEANLYAADRGTP